MLRVPQPRVTSVRRFVGGRATPGDEAVVRVGPGLLALLESPIAGANEPLGAGYHGRSTVPLGLAISACLTIVEPATPGGSWWVGREATLRWLALAALDDTLCGEARLIALSERDALFSIAARSEPGAELLRGEFLLVRVTGGHSVGYPPDAGSARASSLSARARERRAAASPRGVRLRSAPPVLPFGRSAEVVVELSAPGSSGATWEVTARAPAAGGLSIEPPGARVLTVEPGASASVAFTVRADRPDAVNGGEPWVLELRATSGAHEETLTAAIAVPDPDLGRAVDPLDLRDETIASLSAWTAPEPCAADLARRTLRFPVRLLGRGIRVDAAHPVEVTVALPDGFDPAAIVGSSVVQGGGVLGRGIGPLAVTLVDRETPIELEVELTPEGLSQVQARRPAGGPPLRERSEGAQPDLLTLRPPRGAGAIGTYRVPSDVVRLLMNPVAGHGEPLGRRVHPLSAVGVGASLTAAFGLAGDPTPATPARARAAALWIRWLALPDLDFDLEARGSVEASTDGGHRVRVEVFDGWGRRASEAEVVVGHASLAADLLARRRIERPAPPPQPPPPPPAPAREDGGSRLKRRLGNLWRRWSGPGSNDSR
jgi:hypothetical protein